MVQNITGMIHTQHASVIVSDPDGRNFGILVTSLVQVLLDPYYRSLLGLQALIQKDWVTKGFPFRARLGHIRSLSKSSTVSEHIRTASFKGKDDRRDKDLNYSGESPVFVLFLECLHQLLRQNPLEFEYTEQFLVLLYDASHASLFSTFLFDSSFELAEDRNNSLMTVWDFIATNIPQSKYISVFTNACYKLEQTGSSGLLGDFSNLDLKVSSLAVKKESVITEVDFGLPKLCLWNALFFRWLPCTELHKGCSRQVVLQLQQIQYMDELYYLKDRVDQLEQQLKPRELLSPEPEATFCRNKTRHKRNDSRFSNNDEVQNDFLNIMTGFHFLKML